MNKIGMKLPNHYNASDFLIEYAAGNKDNAHTL